MIKKVGKTVDRNWLVEKIAQWLEEDSNEVPLDTKTMKPIADAIREKFKRKPSWMSKSDQKKNSKQKRD